MAEQTADVKDLRRSPAQGVAEQMEDGSGEEVSLAEVRYAVMTALRVEPGSPTAGRVEQALGTALPGGVGDVAVASSGSTGSAASAGERHVLWLGPDEFVTWGPDGSADPPAAAAELAAAVGADLGQAVDVSANRTTLELSGRRAASVLAKSCPLDLHQSAWPAGRAYATALGRVPVVIWRVEPDLFRVLVRSSYAEHLARWLLDSMAEFSDPAAGAYWR